MGSGDEGLYLLEGKRGSLVEVQVPFLANDRANSESLPEALWMVEKCSGRR